MQRFAGESQAVLKVFQEKDLASRFEMILLCVISRGWDCNVGSAECAVKVMTMDGEPAEQLCPQFFKRVASCNLRCNFRCFVHSAQRSLENCLQGDERVSQLIRSLINGYSDGASNMGGFARAVKNSHKLKSMFLQHVQSVDSALQGGSASTSFACQRFDTVLQVSENLTVHLRAVVRTLQECVVRSHHASWALGLLKLLSPRNMILLALLAELCKTCQVYIHRWDNFKKGDVVSMAHASALLEDFKLQVNRLFAFRSPSNELQQPLVLAPEFTAGMLQVLRAGYDMLAGEVR